MIRRFLGRTIDVALLGIPGSLLCRMLFHNWLVAVVLLIPLAVLVYTSVLQSGLGGGQTLGDRLLGVRVLSLEDGRLSFLAALTRSFVGVFMTSQCAMALVVGVSSLGLSRVTILGSLLSFGVVGGCFVMIAFHPLGRGLHDILSNSIAVRGDRPDPAYAAARDDDRDRRIAAALGVGIITIAAVLGALA